MFPSSRPPTGPDSQSRLVLLRHKFRLVLRREIGLMQQGHRDSVDTRAAFNLLRTVAIEFGTCRSGRNGGSPRSISFRELQLP